MSKYHITTPYIIFNSDRSNINFQDLPVSTKCLVGSIYTSLLAFGKGQVVLFSISLSDLVASLLYVYLDLKSRTKQDYTFKNSTMYFNNI